MKRKESAFTPMITCPQCGFMNPAGTSACQLCGCRLSAGEAPAAEPSAPPVREPEAFDYPVEDTAASPGRSAAPAASGGIVCPNCGFENEPDLTYCEKCFAALNTAQPKPSAPVSSGEASSPRASTVAAAGAGTVACAICGHANSSAEQYCLNCGAPLPVSSPAKKAGAKKEPKEPREKKSAKAATYVSASHTREPRAEGTIPLKPILIGAAAVLLIGLVVFLLLHGGGKKNQAVSSAPTYDQTETQTQTGTVVTRPAETAAAPASAAPTETQVEHSEPDPEPEAKSIVIALSSTYSFLRNYEIDLMNTIAGELDVEYEFLPMDGDEELLLAVQAGEADLAIGGIELTRERQAFLDASEAYYSESVNGKDVSYAIYLQRGSEWTSKLNGILDDMIESGELKAMQDAWDLNMPDPGDYLLPQSADTYLTEADLKDLSWEECCLARNEIYARHGRIFATPQIAAYFESKSWYEGTIPGSTFDAHQGSYLNNYETSNVIFILNYEKKTWGRSYY